MSAHLHVNFESKIDVQGKEVKFSALDKPTDSVKRSFTKIFNYG
jgi:hypothetical protein